MKVDFENFNEYCRRQGTNSFELSWSLWDKADGKEAYMIKMYLFIGIDFQTLMEVWSRNIVTYYVLKVVKTFLIDQIKKTKLNGCLRSMKSYAMLGVEPRGSKCINHRDITFSKSRREKK